MYVPKYRAQKVCPICNSFNPGSPDYLTLSDCIELGMSKQAIQRELGILPEEFNWILSLEEESIM